MAAPAQPTTTTIVTDAYKRYGVTNPTTAQITRGIDYGLESVKDLLCLKTRKWKTLRQRHAQTLAPNMSIQVPYFSDVDRVLELNVWESSDSETLFGNSSSTQSQYTLNSSETRIASDFLGKYLAVYAAKSDNPAAPVGNQLVDIVQVLSYNPTTKVCEIYPSGIQTPTTNYVYRILDRKYPLSIQGIQKYNQDVNFPDIKGRPSAAYIHDYVSTYNSTTGFGVQSDRVQFDTTADKTYIIEWYCYVNIQMLNLSDTRHANILRRWKSIFTQGVYVWLLDSNSDDRYSAQNEKLGVMLSALGGQDIDGVDISDMQREVQD